MVTLPQSTVGNGSQNMGALAALVRSSLAARQTPTVQLPGRTVGAPGGYGTALPPAHLIAPPPIAGIVQRPPGAMPLPRTPVPPVAKAPVALPPRTVGGTAAPKPAGTPPLGLPSALLSSYLGQQDAANEAYKTGLANNVAQEGLTRNGYVQQFHDLAQKYGLARAEEPYSFNDHGMLNSGVYHQGLQDLDQNNLSAYGGIQSDESQQLGQLHQAAQSLLAQRDAALASVENQRQIAIAQLGMGSIK